MLRSPLRPAWRHALAPAVALLGLVAAGAAPAAVAPAVAAGASETPESAPLRVLFLGNSYTYYHHMPAMVQALGAADRPPVAIVTGQHTPGGSSLEQHAASPQVARKLEEGSWDVVVLQEQSRRPILDPDRMLTALEALATRARRAGARPVLYATWPRRQSPQTGPAIAAAYRRAGEATGAEVAPVGTVWQQALSATALDLVQ